MTSDNRARVLCSGTKCEHGLKENFLPRSFWRIGWIPILRAMEGYTKSFEALKGMRSLQWKPHLGLVELELELPDRSLDLVVPPVQATTIMHFQQQGEQHGRTVSGDSDELSFPCASRAEAWSEERGGGKGGCGSFSGKIRSGLARGKRFDCFYLILNMICLW